MPPVLQTPRITLKPLEHAHAEAILKLRSHPEVMKYMDSEWCSNLADAEMFICRQNEANKENDGAIWGIFLKDSSKLIGHAGFWKIDKRHFRGEIGYALHPDYWRGGIMGEVLQCIARFGFNELSLHSIEANVNTKNEASSGLLIKLGFKLEAHFCENFYYEGVFHDSLIYSLLKKNLVCNLT